MHQVWGRLLFLHWPLPEAEIRRKVPRGLEIDTWDGSAWIGIAPFTLWGVRPHGLPAVPLLSRSHELNVRTYVHRDGVPGVWFLSLDASNPLAVLGARAGFHLPYFPARMALEEKDDGIRFYSRRIMTHGRKAELSAEWTRHEPLPCAAADSFELYAIERYCLYVEHRGALYRSRIYHVPWPLCRAELHALASTMFDAHELPEPRQAPRVHAQGDDLHVEIWPLERVG